MAEPMKVPDVVLKGEMTQEEYDKQIAELGAKTMAEWKERMAKGDTSMGTLPPGVAILSKEQMEKFRAMEVNRG